MLQLATLGAERRLQRNADHQIANSTLKCTEGAEAIVLRVVHCPRSTVAW
jgi:hypothetical protein